MTHTHRCTPPWLWRRRRARRPTLLQLLLHLLARQVHQALPHHIRHRLVVQQHDLVPRLIQVLGLRLQAAAAWGAGRGS